MGAGRLLFHAGLRVRVVCCTIPPCLVPNHGAFQHSHLVLLSVADSSSCIYHCVFDRLKFRASDVSFAPAPAAGAAVVFAASAIAAFVFHFLQCVAGVRSRSMVAEQNASRPSTNDLTAYLGTSGRSPQSVESIL